MRLLTRDQSRSVDQQAVQKYAFTESALIESAASALLKYFIKAVPNTNKSVLILVGPGNNGQDGRALAQKLQKKSYQSVQIGEWNSNLDNLSKQIKNADVIVDAIFGTGLNRDVVSQHAHLFDLVNSCKAFVVAVDTPSGLNVDTGVVLGACIHADLTITIGLAKPGFFLNQGPEACGKIIVDTICFPKELLKDQSGTHYMFASRAARRLLPKRRSTGNKSDFGRVHIFAGSKRFPGAAVLSSLAAARTGAGYVELSSFSDLSFLVAQIPEVIVGQAQPSRNQSVVVGPGLGTEQSTLDLLLKLKREGFTKVIVDADALAVIAKNNIKDLPSTWIATPHAGELSKILQISAHEIESDRIAAALSAAQKLGCVVLLKGYHTVVSDGKIAVIIRAGNVALAKGGSGDVLTGMIGALRAQGLMPMQAACLGAHIHGLAADLWVSSGRDVLSLIPSDLLEVLPKLLKSIR